MRDLILRKDLNTLMDSFFDDFWTELNNLMSPTHPLVKTRYGYPRLNIHQNDTEYVIEAAIPGLTKNDVTIDYTDNILTISGKKQQQSTIDNDKYIVRELHKSSFSRSVHLDENVLDVNNISANVSNGMLKIKIPKKSLDKSPQKRIIQVS